MEERQKWREGEKRRETERISFKLTFMGSSCYSFSMVVPGE
jgi:hypothetical protein